MFSPPIGSTFAIQNRETVLLKQTVGNRYKFPAALENYMSRVSALESELNLMQTQQDEIRKRIDASKCSLTASAQREKKLASFFNSVLD